MLAKRGNKLPNDDFAVANHAEIDRAAPQDDLRACGKIAADDDYGSRGYAPDRFGQVLGIGISRRHHGADADDVELVFSEVRFDLGGAVTEIINIVENWRLAYISQRLNNREAAKGGIRGWNRTDRCGADTNLHGNLSARGAAGTSEYENYTGHYLAGRRHPTNSRPRINSARETPQSEGNNHTIGAAIAA